MTTRRKRLSLAWLVGGMLGVFIIAGGVLAADLKDGQKGTAWDDAAFQGSAAECAAEDPAEGTTIWHFVLTSAAAGSGTLTAEFENAGTVTDSDSTAKGGTLQWWVVTDTGDTLLDASTDVAGNELNLSHICSNVGTPDGGGSGATEDLPAGTGTVALAVILLAIGGFGFLATTNRLPKLPKIR
jgi:hypothetical protein